MATVSETSLPEDEIVDAVLADEVPAQEEPEPRRRLGFLKTAPAWLISTLFHVGVILILGLVTFAEPMKIVNVLSATATGEEGPEIEEFQIEQIDPGEMVEMEEFTEPVELTEALETSETLQIDVPMEVATVPMEMTDLASDMAPAAQSLQTLSSVMMTPTDSRSADMKKKLLREYGGSAASEAAVTEALKWLALHQAPNGGWTFQHNLVCNGQCGNPGEPKRAAAVNAATAMALLPFLGAGQTHYAGEFKNVVRAGLLFLVANGKKGTVRGLPVLDLSESAGNGMYSHGLAAIVLSEAYAMTEDPALAVPTQQAINFIVTAQCADGGWRYRPREASGGDTSVVGWQVMALKSAHMGHLIVPPQTINGSSLFLDKVQSNGGAMYGYQSPSTRVRPACTAAGLLCRMYLGWDKNHPGLQKGVKALVDIGVRKDNIYYDYYAAQVLRHVGGPEWDKFNTELRDWLVESQSQSGGSKGSWYFPNANNHTGPKEGGRLAATSFATMILEVYYRHMPLYAEQEDEDAFPL
ncbi:hypothetical protein LOC71_12375 [Rhodopirellula sp. JC740]|uniref:Squalene cyclase C-terminal domain-containing protein n=1 Tax=Rhodopirellula halodulae TaxID=2894198 RepID=A0ABS8NI41_9BACT|nr:hypothetical protein [Rhodopirellula sp. JC740]MCC9643074.1 hypothetical protein [Rhodopirellula sp. JC740]